MGKPSSLFGEEHGRQPGHGRILNRNGLAALFDVVPSTINKWQELGMPVLRKGSRGVADQFSSADCLWWRIEYVARSATGQVGNDLSLRKLRANTLLREIELERKAANVAPVDWVIETFNQVFAPVSEILARIAPKVAPLVAQERDMMRCQVIIADAVNEARTSIVTLAEDMKRRPLC